MPLPRDELPVVAQAYRLANGLVPAVQRMPRGLRGVLGAEILREAVSLCATLQEAALRRGHTEALRRADVHLTRLRVTIRLAFDQRAVSPAMYEAFSQNSETLGKMLGGWLRSYRGAHGKDVGVSTEPPAGLIRQNREVPPATSVGAPSTTTAATSLVATTTTTTATT